MIEIKAFGEVNQDICFKFKYYKAVIIIKSRHATRVDVQNNNFIK